MHQSEIVDIGPAKNRSNESEEQDDKQDRKNEDSQYRSPDWPEMVPGTSMPSNKQECCNASYRNTDCSSLPRIE
jgi:hypothetical protein